MSDYYFRYNFVPVKDSVAETYKPVNQPARHDLWEKDHYTGKLTIKVTTKTPTIVGNNHSDKINPQTIEQYTWKGKPAFPANSLKGMISSIAETISQSALRVLDSKYKPAFQKISKNLTPWSGDREELTPAELLFGVVDDGESDTDSNAYTLASRLKFSDALPVNESVEILETVVLKELASPKADGKLPDIGGEPADTNAFSHYFLTDNKKYAVEHWKIIDAIEAKNFKGYLANGRKQYLLHGNLQKQYKNPSNKKARKVQCELIDKNQEFEFTIKYNNLSAKELKLLKTSIEPDPNYIHALGLGKPLGLGAVKLTIEKDERYNIEQLYGKTVTLPVHDNQVNKSLPENADELIDQESLKKLLLFRNQKYAIDSNKIKERNGYKQKTRPIYPPSDNDRLPPIAEEYDYKADKKEEVQSSNKKSTLKLDDSEAAKWFRKTLHKLSQIAEGEEIPDTTIRGLLGGKGLPQKFIALEENDLKNEIRAIICKELEKQQMAENYLKPNFVEALNGCQ